MADLVNAQPDPVRNDNPPTWPMVMNDLELMDLNGSTRATLVDMRDRDRVGFERYGVRIQAFNGRDCLVDGYQEVLDSCVYLRTALAEKHDPKVEDAYRRAIRLAVDIRTFIFERDGR